MRRRASLTDYERFSLKRALADPGGWLFPRGDYRVEVEVFDRLVARGFLIPVGIKSAYSITVLGVFAVKRNA